MTEKEIKDKYQTRIGRLAKLNLKLERANLRLECLNSKLSRRNEFLEKERERLVRQLARAKRKEPVTAEAEQIACGNWGSATKPSHSVRLHDEVSTMAWRSN